MDLEDYLKLVKGYAFLGRNVIAGKVTNKVLDLLAFLDYRLLMYLSMWHPDAETRKKLLRRRGVNISDKAWVDVGVWIEVTTPQAVIIEDYVKLAYGVVIYAHDAAVNSVADLPMRVTPTRMSYNCAIGSRSVIMPGVTVGRHSGVVPGSVVTHDVPDMTVVGGNPARKLFTDEELIQAWQADMRARPELYYDHPSPGRAPSTPLDHIMTWRQENLPIKSYTELRTGTPFDYILDAKEKRKKKS